MDYDFDLTLVGDLTMVRRLKPKSIGGTTMRDYRAILLVAVALILCSAGVAEAGKRKCADDYREVLQPVGSGNPWLGELHAPSRRPADAKMHQGTDPGVCRVSG